MARGCFCREELYILLTFFFNLIWLYCMLCVVWKQHLRWRSSLRVAFSSCRQWSRRLHYEDHSHTVSLRYPRCKFEIPAEISDSSQCVVKYLVTHWHCCTGTGRVVVFCNDSDNDVIYVQYHGWNCFTPAASGVEVAVYIQTLQFFDAIPKTVANFQQTRLWMLEISI